MAYIGKTPTAVPLTSSDITDGIITTAKIADDAISAAKLAAGVGGKIGQVVSTTITAPFSTTNGITGTGFTDITGFSRTITPSATSSKIFIFCTIMCSTLINLRQYFQLIRGSTQICIGDAFSGSPTRMTVSNFNNSSNSETSSVSISFLDSPSSTSQQTYKIQTCNNSGDGNTVFINRQTSSGSGAGDDVTTSTITCMEVLA